MMIEWRYRVRLYARRHPHGDLMWAWEVYDPERPVGQQNVITGPWHDTWDGARREGTVYLACCWHPQRFIAGMPA